MNLGVGVVFMRGVQQFGVVVVGVGVSIYVFCGFDACVYEKESKISEMRKHSLNQTKTNHIHTQNKQNKDRNRHKCLPRHDRRSLRCADRQCKCRLAERYLGVTDHRLWLPSNVGPRISVSQENMFFKKHQN